MPTEEEQIAELQKKIAAATLQPVSKEDISFAKTTRKAKEPKALTKWAVFNAVCAAKMQPEQPYRYDELYAIAAPLVEGLPTMEQIIADSYQYIKKNSFYNHVKATIGGKYYRLSLDRKEIKGSKVVLLRLHEVKSSKPTAPAAPAQPTAPAPAAK